MTEKAPSYADLLVQIEPRPIGSKAALEKTYKLIERLMNKPELNRAESQMLELLSMLVEQYESREHPTPDVAAADLLAYLLESRAITKAKLATATGIPRSTITEILAGRRQISVGNIRKFANFFQLSASLFVRCESNSHKQMGRRNIAGKPSTRRLAVR